MLLDGPGEIVIHRSAQHNAVLGTPVHGLGIQVIHWLLVFQQPAVGLETGEVLCRLFINTRVMFVRAFREVDFGTDNVVE